MSWVAPSLKTVSSSSFTYSKPRAIQHKTPNFNSTVASSLLRADVFVASPIPVVPPLPIPDNITPLWSPTTSTLIHTANEAVLVDPLLTTAQATSLADWIDDLIPNKPLTYIYVTHGHGDHFFGLSTLLERFPNATAVATSGVLAHMEEQLTPAVREFWTSVFPGGQIRFPASPPAKALDSCNPTIQLDGHTLHAVNAGHSDTNCTSFLWVPDLKMAVAGDIVYNGAYSFLAESLAPALRSQWVHAIRTIQGSTPRPWWWAISVREPSMEHGHSTPPSATLGCGTNWFPRPRMRATCLKRSGRGIQTSWVSLCFGSRAYNSFRQTSRWPYSGLNLMNRSLEFCFTL